MHSSTEQASDKKRRHPRIVLQKGMFVAWHGGDLQLFSRVKTLGTEGLFISVPNPPPVDTKLRLAFDVPGGNVHAQAIVRNIVPGEGMGVEFTRMDLKDRVLLEHLLFVALKGLWLPGCPYRKSLPNRATGRSSKGSLSWAAVVLCFADYRREVPPRTTGRRAFRPRRRNAAIGPPRWIRLPKKCKTDVNIVRTM